MCVVEREKERERERERERIVCVTKRTIVYDFTPKKKYTFPFC